MNFFYIIGCILLTVLGQLLVKKGSIQLKGVTSFFSYAMNIYILSGLLSAFLTAVLWIKALQNFNLSFAYPFMSLSFILVLILSLIIFDEQIRTNQWIGLGIVILGLYVGSR